MSDDSVPGLTGIGSAIGARIQVIAVISAVTVICAVDMWCFCCCVFHFYFPPNIHRFRCRDLNCGSSGFRIPAYVSQDGIVMIDSSHIIRMFRPFVNLFLFYSLHFFVPLLTNAAASRSFFPGKSNLQSSFIPFTASGISCYTLWAVILKKIMFRHIQRSFTATCS